ncbi:MAG: preprotein translocase subunit YajC [Deltaproteobacteria bacterium]|nr:preprotein translocase subunit YajC [Deltaproteobacteria bacterium]
MYLFPVEIAHAAEEGGGLGGILPAGILPAGVVANFFPFIVLIAIFYFMLIRPQQKSAKKHREMLGKLQKGDNVVTRGGIYGRVSNVKDDSLIIEIADNVRIKVERSAVQEKKGGESA